MKNAIMRGWLKSSLVLLVVAILALGVESQASSKKWWQTASFYQIYPRSFRDSDGNGIGDLKGISEKLAYLKEIGVAATWLSPIFTSPMADFGYDIANFTEIDPMFGTMEDFEELITKAKEIGVKIILDFVPNHSSDECEWFQKSIERDPEYADYYVWHPGKLVDGVRQPPTNWISVFRGSMWTWNEVRQEYYLHQFHAKQPDFNYRNPKVKEMMKDVLRFWLRKGVSGFRIDALPHVFEVDADENGDWPDEPINENVSDPEDYSYLDHIYTANQPETIELVYEFRSVIEEINNELGGDDRIIMTEAYAPLEIQMQYYGNETVDGAHIPFNFQLISNLNANSNAAEYASLINSWLNAMPAGKTANWVMGNHDQSRIATRMGSDKVDIINILLLTLPGCSVTYNGEEIGMSDVWISWNDTMDPQGCQSNPDEYERLSRDPCRTPFQWSNSNAAGFTEGNETWLPVSDNFEKVNVMRERGITFSHLNVFKNLQKLRDYDAFRDGDTEVKSLNSNVLAVKRSSSASQTYVTLLNINNAVETVNLSAAFSGLGDKCQYVIVTGKSRADMGDHVNTKSVLLMPHEAIVLKSIQ